MSNQVLWALRAAKDLYFVFWRNRR
jgi:hypothetical protein